MLLGVCSGREGAGDGERGNARRAPGAPEGDRGQGAARVPDHEARAAREALAHSGAVHEHMSI